MRFIVLLSSVVLVIGFQEFAQFKNQTNITDVNELQIKPMAKHKLTQNLLPFEEVCDNLMHMYETSELGRTLRSLSNLQKRIPKWVKGNSQSTPGETLAPVMKLSGMNASFQQLQR